jgi:hypothetical protein
VVVVVVVVGVVAAAVVAVLSTVHRPNLTQHTAPPRRDP